MGKKSGRRPLNIVMISSEAAPYSKTGGLADVAGSLSRALAGLGHNVHLFTPLYRSVNRESLGLFGGGVEIKTPISARVARGRVYTAKDKGVYAHFVENPGYYDRPHLYNTPSGDYADNAERFIFFSRAALEGIKGLGLTPDIIHVNDWQTSLIPVYMKTLYKDDPSVGAAVCAMTIHNLGYQGLFWNLDWHLTGLDWGLFGVDGLEFHGKINFLKGGIIFSDIVTTVSETYAREILTPEYGWGLEGVLSSRAGHLHGVLNGIDAEEWNPATDKFLPANYSASALEGKKICKAKVLEEVGLPLGDEPLLGVVSRLVEQKGFDLLTKAMDRILETGAKLVLLGSGRDIFEKFFVSLAEKRPAQVAARIGFDEGLAHRIEAGSDIFLMPSHYEPCGLNQMYSLAYGTAPVVRATGGLNDTVRNYDPETGEGNGFKFEERSAEALFKKTMETMELMRERPSKWVKMIRNGMKEDHSWPHSARIYESLYRQALSERKEAAL